MGFLRPEVELASRLFRDRGFKESVGWAGRPDTMGCEPVVCSWPPLRLPGCAVSTDP